MQPRSGGRVHKSRGGQCGNHLQDRCACAPALTQVGVRKLLQLAVRVIQVKAFELFGTQLFAGTVDLMLEAAHVLCWNCLGGTVVQLHVSAKHSCRKLQHSDNSIPDCNHLFVLELLGIMLCMAGRVMAKFAALKLEVVFGHNKSEHAQASGTPAHWTLINRINDAARLVYLPFLP